MCQSERIDVLSAWQRKSGATMINVRTLLVRRLVIITLSRTMIVVLALAWASACSFEAPDFNFEVEDLATAQSSRVYDRTGVLITELRGEQGRTDINDINSIPEIVQNAIIAIEDERFYAHDGVDLKAILRAARSNVASGAISQGGSTITQQYVGNVFLDRSDQTVTRKIKEIFMALRFEQGFTKDFVLLRYLNWVYFGNGAYGIEAAAREYFGTPACQGVATLNPQVAFPDPQVALPNHEAAHSNGSVDQTDTDNTGDIQFDEVRAARPVCLKVSELTLEQAALLAGLIQRPSALDPYRRPNEARRRRNLVLERMLANGFVSAEQYEAAVAQPLVLVEDVPILEEEYPAAYFVEDVKQWFLSDPRFGSTRQDRTRLLFEGGLDIHTTVDIGLQAEAEAAVEAILPGNGVNPDAAAVVIGIGGDEDGHVLAMVGGRDFFADDSDAKFNLASGKGRQAGSAMKPVALAAALADDDRRFSLGTVYEAPNKLVIDRRDMCGPRPWTVHGGRGSTPDRPVFVNLEDATRSSVNTVYAQLMVEIHPDNFVAMAEALGARHDSIAPVCAAVLGTEDVNMVELATMYATFGRSGRRVDPVIVTEILRPDGTSLYQNVPDAVPVLEPSIAHRITHALRSVIIRGTGRKAAISRQAAGKTGTAQNYADASFAGYTPQRAAAVWVGYPVAQIPMVPPTTDIRVSGGSYPAMIWREIMHAAHKDINAADFPEPPMTTTTTTTTVAPAAGPTRLEVAEVPDLTGRMWDRDEITREMEGLTLGVSALEVITSEFTEGTIVGQIPPAGSQQPAWTIVTVDVAIPPELPETATVPDVTGLSASEAWQILAATGMIVEVVTESRSEDGTVSDTGDGAASDSEDGTVSDQPGAVWRQSPAAGTAIESVWSTTIWVTPDP